MARRPRTLSATGVYHIVIRGINLQRIFEEDEDRLTFLEHLQIAKDISNASLLAYCLMGNHAHLIIEQGDESLGVTMKRLLVRYVSWFNMKYGRVGHLFQDRFKSEAVESDSYLVTVLRYVYSNPLKAGLCDSVEDYAWSSYRLLESEGGLIDAARLADLCDIDDLLFFEPEKGQDGILDIRDPQKHKKTDAAAVEIMHKTSNAASSSAFQALDKSQQILTVTIMLDNGVSIRQAARITGLSKGLVESWTRSSKSK